MSRKVLITGATGGLGRGVAAHFLAAGYQVVAADLGAEGVQALGSHDQLSYRQLNVTDEAEVRQLAQELGSLDVLVNLVGGFAFSSLSETSLESFEQMLNLNVRSCFVMCQGLLPLLLQSQAGRIINVGARQALLGGPLVSAYALSKAAVVNFTQSLAAEVKDSLLTVNAVVPSTIDTPANRQSMPEADFEKWVQPADLAAVMGFLASTEARAVSGAVIPVYHKA